MTAPSAIASAAEWTAGVLTGPAAVAVAIIAVGWMGMLMLSGRIDVRRGGTVIAGCFIVFGASAIERGLRSIGNAATSPIDVSVYPMSAPPAVPNHDLPRANNDPYAGASVPTR